MNDAPRCHEDGAEMVRDVRPMELSYKGETLIVDMPGWYCPKCPESFHAAKDARESDRALNRLKSKHENLLPSAEIRRIRKKLGLTQKEAGIIIGGGPKAFCKYEKYDSLPSRSVVSALLLLDANPAGVELLKRGAAAGPWDAGDRKSAKEPKAA